MNKKALDELGVAIANAGYVWTPEMRKAYEKGIRKSKWVGLTDEEILDSADAFGCFQYGDAQGHKRLEFARTIEAKLKEKNT